MDVKDEFELENISIEEETGLGFQAINLENFGISNIEKFSCIWVLEVLKYDEVNYNIENNSLNLTHESPRGFKLN